MRAEVAIQVHAQRFVTRRRRRSWRRVGGGSEAGDVVAFGGDHGGGDNCGDSPGVEVGGLEVGDEAVEGTPTGGVGPADGGKEFEGGGDAGVGGEELGVAVAEGDEAGVGEVGEECGEEVERVGRGGGVEEVEDAGCGHEGIITGSGKSKHKTQKRKTQNLGGSAGECLGRDEK